MPFCCTTGQTGGLAPGTIKTYLAAVTTPPSLTRVFQWPAASPHHPEYSLQIYTNWSEALRVTEFDNVMIWSAMVTCFFIFFCAGELTVPMEASFDTTAHLAGGVVVVDEACPQGIAVFLGTTLNALCPVSAILAYVARRGDAIGVFFRFQSGSPLMKTCFVA